MTFEELKTEVFRRLDEDSSSPAYWTETDVEMALNEGYQEISDASEWYERNYNLPLKSKQTYYDLTAAVGDTAVLTLKHLFNSTTKRWLTPTEPRELDYQTYVQWERTTGEPQSWFVRGLFWLGVFPKQGADSGGIKAYFTSLPDDLEADYDEPGFPEEYHYGLVEYAIGDLLAQEAETTKALSHFGEYMTYEAGLKKWTEGRISLDRITRLHG